MDPDLILAQQDPAAPTDAVVDGFLAVGTTWVLSLGLWLAAGWANATTLFEGGPVPGAQIALEWTTAALACSAPVAGAVACCLLGLRIGGGVHGRPAFGLWTAVAGSCPALILVFLLSFFV